MRDVFITADHHFGHTNILRFCNRPFPNIYEHDKELIKRWNSLISKDALIYYVGDLMFRNAKHPLYYKEKLNGEIKIIRGNHDKQKVLKEFEWYQNLPIIIGEFTCLLNHRPCYRPDAPDPFHDNDVNVNPMNYDFIISGHTHKFPLFRWKSLNVGVDLHDFYPLHMDQVYALLTQRKKELENGFS